MNALVKLPIGIAYAIGPDIDHVWPRIENMVRRACDDTLTPEEVYASIAQRRALAWIVTSGEAILACLVTREGVCGDVRWLEVMTAGGERFREWSGLMQQALEEQAEAIGATAIRATARRGMAKWLKALGWRERQIIMEWRRDG